MFGVTIVPRYRLVLDTGDGKLRGLQASLNMLNRQINRVYRKGKNNNNQVSNKDITNLRRMANRLTDSLESTKVDRLNTYEKAKQEGDLKEARHALKDLQLLTDALKETKSAIYDENSTYNVINNNFKITSSKNFESSRSSKFLQDMEFDINNTFHEIGYFTRRASLYQSRWETTRDTGSITEEQKLSYEATSSQLHSNYEDFNKQLNELKEFYDVELELHQENFNNLQSKSKNGTISDTEISYMAGLTEDIDRLKQFSEKISYARVHLNRANKSITETDKRMEQDYQSNTVKVLGSRDSVSGWWRNHGRGAIRQASASAIGSIVNSHQIGNQLMVGSYDSIKSVSYATGVKDTKIQNTLADYKDAVTYNDAVAYLNAYVSGSGDANISRDQISDLLSSWSSLANYNAVSDASVQELLATTSKIADNTSISHQNNLERQIQNALTNSGMATKGNQQIQALTSMYNTAYQYGGNLDKSQLTSMAGFQAQMAQGGSVLQGSQGADAYNHFSSIFSSGSAISDNTARYIFAGGDPQYNSYRGQAVLTEDMQNASKDPTKYRNAISNLLNNASAFSDTKSGQRKLASANLVVLSHNSLSAKQAEKLVELYQSGKFNKKEVNKAVSGNYKGSKSTYDKSGTKTIKQSQSAREENSLRTAHALNVFTKALLPFKRSFLVNIGSQIVGGVGGALVTEGIASYAMNTKLGKNLFSKEGLSEIASGVKGVLSSNSVSKIRGSKVTGYAVKAMRGLKSSRGGKIGLVAGGLALGSYMLNRHDKADASTNKPEANGSNNNNNKISTSDGSSHHTSTFNKHTDSYAKSMIGNLANLFHIKHRLIYKDNKLLIRKFNTFWDIWLKRMQNKSEYGADTSDDIAGSNDSATTPDGWRDIIKKAAKASGVTVSDSQVDTIVRMIKAESGGDQTVVQKISDINSANGDPAKGLLQFTTRTFNAYAVPGHTNIFSGYDQLLALFNDSNWQNDLRVGGWGPTGKAIRTNAYGSIRQGVGNMLPISDKSDQIGIMQDLSDLQMSARVKSNSQVPVNNVKYNKPKITVNINTDNAVNYSDNKVISDTINYVFDSWISSKKMSNLARYYGTTNSGLYV